MSTIKTFEEKVNYCKSNLTNDIINNSAISHASYLFKALLSVASEKKEAVKIVSGSLNNDFYGDLLDSLQECINNKVHIELIVMDGSASMTDSKFCKLINDYEFGDVYQARADLELEGPHMLLVGEYGQRYRLETDHAQTKAIASFDGDSTGELLIKAYATVKNMIINPPDLLTNR